VSWFTGNEPGTCRLVSPATNTSAANSVEGFCRARPQPEAGQGGHSLTNKQLVVSGTITAARRRSTGDEPGTCQSLDGARPTPRLEQAGECVAPTAAVNPSPTPGPMAWAPLRPRFERPPAGIGGVLMTGASQSACEPLTRHPLRGRGPIHTSLQCPPSHEAELPPAMEAQPSGNVSVQIARAGGPSAAGTQASACHQAHPYENQRPGSPRPFDLAVTPSPAPNSPLRRRAPQQAASHQQLACTKMMPAGHAAPRPPVSAMPTAPDAPDGLWPTPIQVEERGPAEPPLRESPAKASPPRLPHHLGDDWTVASASPAHEGVVARPPAIPPATVPLQRWLRWHPSEKRPDVQPVSRCSPAPAANTNPGLLITVSGGARRLSPSFSLPPVALPCRFRDAHAQPIAHLAPIGARRRPQPYQWRLKTWSWAARPTAQAKRAQPRPSGQVRHECANCERSPQRRAHPLSEPDRQRPPARPTRAR